MNSCVGMHGPLAPSSTVIANTLHKVQAWIDEHASAQLCMSNVYNVEISVGVHLPVDSQMHKCMDGKLA